MKHALAYAKQGQENDCVPVGCVLVYQNHIITGAHNGTAPFEHAEYLAIRQAYTLIGEKIREAILYVTLEPCAMCAAMMSLCCIKSIIFGAYDTKNGGLDHNQKITLPHVIGGIMEKECGQILSHYFQGKRYHIGKTDQSQIQKNAAHPNQEKIFPSE
jgi:tRNA(adenine34) deaminase